MFYKSVPSALLPIPHSEELLVLMQPVSQNNDAFFIPETERYFSEYAQSEVMAKPILMSHDPLNALMRKLSLSKNNAGLLAADLKDLNFLDPGVQVTSFRSRHHIFIPSKIHFLNSHMDYFENQLASEPDEHGERFHQTCLPIEERYKGKNLHGTVADLCLTMLENGIELPRAKRRRD